MEKEIAAGHHRWPSMEMEKGVEMETEVRVGEGWEIGKGRVCRCFVVRVIETASVTRYMRL